MNLIFIFIFFIFGVLIIGYSGAYQKQKESGVLFKQIVEKKEHIQPVIQPRLSNLVIEFPSPQEHKGEYPDGFTGASSTLSSLAISGVTDTNIGVVLSPHMVNHSSQYDVEPYTNIWGNYFVHGKTPGGDTDYSSDKDISDRTPT